MNIKIYFQLLKWQKIALNEIKFRFRFQMDPRSRYSYICCKHFVGGNEYVFQNYFSLKQCKNSLIYINFINFRFKKQGRLKDAVCLLFFKHPAILLLWYSLVLLYLNKLDDNVVIAEINENIDIVSSIVEKENVEHMKYDGDCVPNIISISCLIYLICYFLIKNNKCY